MIEKKPRKQKRDYDFAVNAFRVVQEATGQIPEPQETKPLSSEDKHAAAVALGRLGGLKGGKARLPSYRRNAGKKLLKKRLKLDGSKNHNYEL